MKFGVNYTPSQNWFHFWLDFDADQVARDLDTLAELGIDHIRIFPLWPIIQPNRTLIRQAALDDIHRVVVLAHERGLETYVDALQGHLSSFDFLPAWVTSWHRANLFTDPKVVSGQVALVKKLAEMLRDTPGAAGLSLGNEFIQFAASRHPFRHEVAPAHADRWLETLLQIAKQAWPAGTHVHTHDDDLWFEPTQPFTPAMATGRGDATTVHSWVFGRIGPRFGKDSDALPWFARYLCELAAAYGAPARPIWLQEIGAPLNYVSAERAADFLTATIARLTGSAGGGLSPNVRAITWWCSHDVSRSLTDFPEVEYSLGLIDSAGQVKPIGRAFAAAIADYEDVAPADSPRSTLRLEVNNQTRNLADAHHEFFDQWLARAQSGDVARIEIAEIASNIDASKEK
ncbi:MAG: hypothetical protein Q4A71_04855 [Actinomycetaceae bacterium]|nr:hypothetical protein [Actinomycetaceae bacterium]